MTKPGCDCFDELTHKDRHIFILKHGLPFAPGMISSWMDYWLYCPYCGEAADPVI
jgi:hypothetical protein